jgi:hypothetical protein
MLYICIRKLNNQTNKTMRTFISGSGTKVVTADKAEIKRVKACGWKEVKSPTIFYAKGLMEGKNYLN